MPRSLTPWVVLAASLALSAVATSGIASGVAARDRARFENAARSTQDRIRAHLDAYIALLRGGTGLFAADGEVDRSEFRAYVDRLALQSRYPGIQGIGFSKRLRPGEQDSLVATTRAQDVPNFRVWPDTPRAEYHAILYLEPLDRRNQAAIGYDMFSNPTRRAAMARARDTGLPAMSGQVTLVQEIEERKQAGFLIYTPVYRGGGIPPTVAARRAGLEGFVYSPFRADDLFSGIFGTAGGHGVEFRIYDGPSAQPAALLHDSRQGAATRSGRPAFADTTRLEIAGRTWTLVFTPSSALSAASERSWVSWVAGAGLLVSLVLFALSWTQVAARAAAERHAAESEDVAKRLQEQAAELEHQTEEAQALAKELEASNEELLHATDVAEAARAEAEREREKVTDVLDSITDASFAVDHDWRATYVNAAFERITGRYREDLLGRDWWKEFPEAVSTRFYQEYQRAMRERVPVSLEEYYLPREIWYDVRAYPTRDGGLAVYFRDITRRRRAEEQARFLADLNQALQILTDPGEVTGEAARRLGEHLGADRCAYAEVEADEDHFTITGDYTRGGSPSIVGRYAMSAFGEAALRAMRENEPYVVDDVEADDRVTGVDQAAYQMTRIQAVVCVPLHKAGWFVAGMAVHQETPRRWSREEVELVTAVTHRCWEAIERARTLRRLGESERRLRLAQEAGRVGVFEWLIPEGRVIWADELEHLYGLPSGAFEGGFDDWRKRVVPEDAQAVEAGIEAALQGRREEYAYEFRAVLPDGTHRWLAGQARFAYAEDGSPLRMIGINLDVHERKQAERERERLLAEARAARAAAEEANRSKSQFLANMSHELRTPLNAIGGYADLLEMGIRGPVTDAQRGDLERIKRAQKHLLGLINDVLNFAKLEAGRVEFDLKDVHLDEVLTETEALIAPQALARGIVYRHCPVGTGIVARADRDKVQQILLNLLSNAVKFTQPGGEVTVECDARDGTVEVCVLDTGIGIPSDRLPVIFEPFVQVNADLTRTAQGTGLGLAISRELAHGMGGDLTVESAFGEGSTFTLTLPRWMPNSGGQC